jgi:hypothetical protein
VEGYGKVTIGDDVVVRRAPINREIARLDTGWVCGITKIDGELRWRSAHNSASTGSAGDRTTHGCGSRCWRWRRASLRTIPPAGVESTLGTSED